MSGSAPRAPEPARPATPGAAMPPPAPVAAAPSPRALLARLALDAALATDGVVGPHEPRGAPGAVTGPEGAPLAGVRVLAAPGERYDIALHLRARPVDLRALGARVRAAACTAAERAGGSLAGTIGRVDVMIDDVTEA